MPKLSGYAALATLPEERVTDKITRRIASGDQEMIVWWNMKAGAHATAHKHANEQIAWILKGRMEFRLGNERRTWFGRWMRRIVLMRGRNYSKHNAKEAAKKNGLG